MVQKAHIPDSGTRGHLRSFDFANHWITSREPDFGEHLQVLLDDLEQVKTTAETRVYKPKGVPTLGDVWMHRMLVSRFIAEIQQLVIERFFEEFALKPIDTETGEMLERVEEEITSLIDLLHQWHGSPETQREIPDEFLESMDKAMKGEVEDFDQGFHARFEAVK